MADLDKKIQKNQPDLVQSVLEAFEKRNVERVDILITNAIKQLKGSRFKPDQSICIGLFYLARVQPKVFSQSANLKEYLKTHIKRDGVPANIKGNKTDFFLPVLVANILLASCDSPDVRSSILTRIGQWISANQKLNELVQHVLATLCVRCHDDQATIKILIDTRYQWFDFLEKNFNTYGRVSPNLAHSIRDLLGNATSCEAFTESLTFLIKHDSDVVGLCSAISKFIVQKPLTFNSILAKGDQCTKLVSMMLDIFEAYFQQNVDGLKDVMKKDETEQVIIFNLQSNSQIFAMDEVIVRAVLLLMSTYGSDRTDEFPCLRIFLDRWLTEAKLIPNSSKIAFLDVSLTKPHQFSNGLLLKMLGRTNRSLHELAIYSATPAQLIELAITFGLTTDTLNDIFERLDSLSNVEFARVDMKDFIYFNEIMDHYSEIGVKRVEKLRDRLNNIDLTEQDCKKAEQHVEIKIKKEIT